MNGQTASSMKVNFSMTKCMERECTITEMGICTKESSKTIRSMEKGSTCIQMDWCSKGLLCIIYRKDKGFLNCRMEKSRRLFGKKAF